MNTMKSTAKKYASQFRRGDARIIAIVDACRFDLATIFEVPSRDMLGAHGSKLGLSSSEMGDLLRLLCD